MRPLPARILFSLLAVVSAALGVITGRPILLVVTAISLFLLTTSLLTSRLPLARALSRFRNQAVEVRLWGGSPPDSGSGTFVLTDVNVISAGTHVYFSTSDGTRMHLKVAQPRDVRLTTGAVVIAEARYIQWNRTRIRPQPGAPAAAIALSG
jgi:hypothetical protein